MGAIWELSGKVSNEFGHDFDFLLALWDALWALQEHSQVDLRRGRNSVNFLLGIELSSSAYSYEIWPMGKHWRKTKCFKTYVFPAKVVFAVLSPARERRDPHQLRI